MTTNKLGDRSFIDKLNGGSTGRGEVPWTVEY